jgi:Uma2 family endonuclease
MATSEQQIFPNQTPPFSLMPDTEKAELMDEELPPKPKLIDRENQIEIVNGNEELKEMSGLKADGIANRLAIEIGIYLKSNKIGRVYGADTMFTFLENERMPDVSFVSQEKIPETGEPLTKADFAPDLAIEVASPNDVHNKIIRKIHKYFKAGVKEVWLVESEFEMITVYQSLAETKIYLKDDELPSKKFYPVFVSR